MDPILEQPQTDYYKGYVHIDQELLGRKDFTPADKLVAARISGFEVFYESPTATAEFLGVSVASVKRAKIKLEKMGALILIKDTGHGKKYRVDQAALIHQMYQFDTPDNQNLTTCRANLTQQVYQFDTAGVSNCDTDNKKILNEKERLLLKDKSFNKAQAPAEDSEKDPLNDDKPKSYGKAEINELLELWREETGFDHKSTKSERYAINNLLRKNGYEATKALIRRVGRARRSDNQFAPQIAKPSQLQGKYSKMEALVLWEERQSQAEQPKTATGRPIIEGPKVPVFEPDKDVRDGKTEEELRAECQAIRDKYKGTKFEHIFNGGRK